MTTTFRNRKYDEARRLATLGIITEDYEKWEFQTLTGKWLDNFRHADFEEWNED